MITGEAHRSIVSFLSSGLSHSIAFVSQSIVLISSSSSRRSTGFFSLGATVLIFELIGSPLTSHLMKSDMWLPILIGLSLYIPIIIGALCLPETLGVSQVESKPNWMQSTDASVSDSGVREQQTRRFSWVPKSGDALTRKWSSASSVIHENTTVSLLLLTFLCTVLGNEAHEMLLQFARRRFGWSWSQVSPLHR